MLIVLEGPDLAGKTSVARALNDQIPLSTLLKLSGAPKSVYDPGWMQSVYTSLIPFLVDLGNKSHVILDRFMTSEWVYAPIFKGYDANYITHLSAALEQLVPVKYYLLDVSTEVAEQRLETKRKNQPNEMHQDIGTFTLIQEWYYQWFQVGYAANPHRYKYIDTSELSVDETVRLIMDDIEPNLHDFSNAYSEPLKED